MDKELFKRMLNNRNFTDELTKKQDEWERANKIFPDTAPFGMGLTIAVICFIIFIPFETSQQFKTIYSTIIGGAIGNFYDRIAFKAVPDFIDLHYNNFHWFVFNLADVFITIGILTLIISEMLKKN